MNPPNKVMKSPMSLVTSKKTPPTLIIISPILIGYWGLNFKSFFINGNGGYGQVPQTGLFSFDRADELEKYEGSELIFVTHQPDRFWLKAVALLNI